MFVSGLTGSGKSYYISNLLKHNKPKFIFIMSPVHNDPAYTALKPTPIHLDILAYEREYDKNFEIEDIRQRMLIELSPIRADFEKLNSIWRDAQQWIDFRSKLV